MKSVVKTGLVVVVCFLFLSTTASFGQGSCNWSAVGSGVVQGSYGLGVGALTVFDDGTGSALYVGGDFIVAGSATVNGIAKWDGMAWSPLGSGVGGGSSSRVHAMTVFDDGTGPALYVAGKFTLAGGVTASNIAKWDGSAWSPLGSGVGGASQYVRALTIFDDGTGPALYAAGRFTLAGGVGARNIAKWDGTTWSPLGSGLVGFRANGLTVFDDGTGAALYAVGLLTAAGGVAVNNIARWDGATWSPLGSGLSNGGVVYAMTVFDDGTGPALYAGGNFWTAGGVTAHRVAKWDGATWSALGSGLGDGVLHTLTVFDNGTGPALYIGGVSLSFGGVAASLIARWDGATWSSLGSGLGGPGNSPNPEALTVFDDGTGPALYAGGQITTAGGVAVGNVARWACGSTISISHTQPGGPGSAVHVNNANLTPGNEYYNIFSIEACAGGIGSGPYLGLCASPGPNLQLLIDQLLLPEDAPPFHFLSPSSYVNWGPFILPPLVVDGICIDVTGGVIGPVSQVTRITIQ